MLRKEAAPGWRGFLLCLMLLVGGCATPQTTAVLQDAAGLPRQVELAEVPFHPQEALMCGPASLAMALNWAGAPVTPQEITPLLFTPGREGTLQTEMVTAARRLGYLAYPVHRLDAVLAELAAGHPVVILQNLGLSWVPVWHYAVAIGYDLEAGEMVLHSGPEEREVLSLPLFERTWARSQHWAMVLLPPGRLPATAAEPAYLDAALGLERAGQHAAAAAAFQAAMAKWPDSLPVLLGLGNSRYGEGDRRAAARAFETAVERHPRSADAHNNLAHVLLELGERDRALQSARRAVDLGGPNLELFRRTLDEAEQRASAGS